MSEMGNAHITNESTDKISEISVYSLTGQLIFTGKGDNNTFSYSVPGIYTARILYASGQQESKMVPLK